jgi:hypothetical protein
VSPASASLDWRQRCWNASLPSLTHACDTSAAAEKARLLIEHAEAAAEPPNDPLLLFSVLYFFWAANFAAFNGDALRDLAAQFLALAEKHGSPGPLVVGHRLMGHSLVSTGSMLQGRAHFDKAVALYDPIQHRPLATRFGQDIRVATLAYRCCALWMLGYPDAALLDADRAVKDARDFGEAAALMYAIYPIGIVHLCCGNVEVAATLA